ncbi:hypothetical protein NM208_g13257 [Fusarium decemcellulare]|uniref:Uncharacterized protein n=1 Tax=Fusarium decemcellulare TaxID=57161 RepID=A0ACC1RPT8_9HYPO|nr:hypothetical protein NM208_g13257 [Fusarium decemcellulare]
MPASNPLRRHPWGGQGSDAEGDEGQWAEPLPRRRSACESSLISQSSLNGRGAATPGPFLFPSQVKGNLNFPFLPEAGSFIPLSLTTLLRAILYYSSLTRPTETPQYTSGYKPKGTMKFTAPFLLASAASVSALTQQCSGTALEEGGNWFCGAVKQILYEGFAGSGTYKAVTNMGKDGQCDSEDIPYSGPLAPLDEDITRSVKLPHLLMFMLVVMATTTSTSSASTSEPTG